MPSENSYHFYPMVTRAYFMRLLCISRDLARELSPSSLAYLPREIKVSHLKDHEKDPSEQAEL